MNTSELRIGNNVLWKREREGLKSQIVQVYNITRSGVRVYTGIEELPEVLLNESDIEPILLKGDKIQALGFECCDSNYLPYSHKTGIDLCNSNSELFFYGNSGPIGQPLKTVHQFQNGFYFLTGEELYLEFDEVERPPVDNAPNELPF